MTQDIWRIKLLKAILIIGAITLFAFSIIYVVNEDYVLSIIESLVSISMVVSYFWVTKGGYRYPAIIGWCGVFVVLLTLLISGGIAGGGLVWWALIPVVSFMMFGLDGGFIAVTASVVALMSAAVFKQYNLLPIFFDINKLIQAGISLTVIGAIMYFSEKITRTASEDALAKTALLEKAKNDMQSSFAKIQDEKEKQVDVSRAVVNILEDSKELERKLQEERDKAQTIITSMPSGLITVDENANLTIINPIAESLLGVKAADFIGKSWLRLATTLKDNKDVPTTERSFSQTLKTGKVVITSPDDNRYYKSASGKIFPIASVTAPLKTDGKIIGAVKVFRDATQEKEQKAIIEQKVVERTAQLEKANEEINNGWLQLQQEKAKLSSSIENMPVGFLMVDITGNLIVVNSLAKKILGRKDDNETYEELKTIVKSKIDLVEYIRTCSQDTKTISLSDLTLLDGRFLRVIVSPILSIVEDNQKKCVGIVTLVEDITEAKILERSKDEFFSIASHELRTPLTAIRGNTSLMKEMYTEKLKDPELIEMIDDVHTSAIRLINIVNDFLNVSRLEMGKIDFKKTTFDFVPLAMEVINELKEQASQKKLELLIGTPKIKSLNVFSDRDRVKEVLINLVGNAIKYTDKGKIEIDFTEEKTDTKISIRDTGNGISSEGQKLLFHKFQQAGNSILTRDTTKSTGLGLYISKLMIEGMGGKVWLEASTIGKGSIFSFTLPNQ